MRSGRCRWRSTSSSGKRLIAVFCDTELAAKGMVVDWAIHALRGDDGEFAVPPHVHFLITSRTWDRRNAGQWQKSWITSHAQVNALGNVWYELTGMSSLGFSPSEKAAA